MIIIMHFLVDRDMSSLAQDLAMEQALHDMAPLTPITPSATQSTAGRNIRN